MASFQRNTALNLWVCGGEGVSVQSLCLTSLQCVLTANKSTSIARGHEAQDPVLSWPISLSPPNCFPLNRSRIYGSMKCGDACLTALSAVQTASGRETFIL